MNNIFVQFHCLSLYRNDQFPRGRGTCNVRALRSEESRNEGGKFSVCLVRMLPYTVFNGISAAALIKLFTPQMQCLLEDGVYLEVGHDEIISPSDL